jgi:hypothetical protein
MPDANSGDVFGIEVLKRAVPLLMESNYNRHHLAEAESAFSLTSL